MSRFAVVSMTGAKEERDKLRYRGDHAQRARIFAEDTLMHYQPDGLLITGMSHYQMKTLDSYMLSRGFIKLISPDFRCQKDAWRYTQLTLAYLSESLNAKQIRYDEEKEIETIYRYVAFSLPDENQEIRVMHVPCADSEKPNYEKQLSRKKRMLSFERHLEEKEISLRKKVISCGDYNTEIGNLECHEVFDDLPYKKLLDEPTWGAAKIDNVLVSPGQRVSAHTEDFRYGQTSDHKTVIFEI